MQGVGGVNWVLKRFADPVLLSKFRIPLGLTPKLVVHIHALTPFHIPAKIKLSGVLFKAIHSRSFCLQMSMPTSTI